VTNFASYLTGVLSGLGLSFVALGVYEKTRGHR